MVEFSRKHIKAISLNIVLSVAGFALAVLAFGIDRRDSSEAIELMITHRNEIISQLEVSKEEIITQIETDNDKDRETSDDKDRGMAATRPATSGEYLVQVGTYRGPDLAIQNWEKMVQRNAVLLAPYRPDLEIADLGPKGIYYRIRVGPFDTRSDAEKLCQALKDRRQDCLVRKV